jgi:hypothetical protein
MQGLSQQHVAALKMLDTCLVSDAINRLNIRLSNSGYADSRIRSQFKNLGSMVGYAVTAKVYTAETPMVGGRVVERRELWEHALAIPEPRVLVLQDMAVLEDGRSITDCALQLISVFKNSAKF